jgi:hypothetical protein
MKSLNKVQTDEAHILATDIDRFTVPNLARSFNQVVAHNAFDNSAGKALNNCESMIQPTVSQTHVIDILQADRSSYIETNQNARDIVSKYHSSVFAIAKGKGHPFASALLVAQQLILTDRHCVENLEITSLCVRINYQMTSAGVSYGEIIRMSHVVEEDIDLDYAIIALSKPVPKSIQPLKFSLVDRHEGKSIFIHHPYGGPKKVSIHVTLESTYEKLCHSGFHDSYKGSSGGAYFDNKGLVFALHKLNKNKITSGGWIKNIFAKSEILKSINTYDISSCQNTMTFIEATECNKEYHEKKLSTRLLELTPLEKKLGTFKQELGPFSGKMAIEAPNELPQARHHIVPEGDMQFLWVMGQECEKLGNLLCKLAYQCANLGDTATINATEWSPWNIFIGPLPKYRNDDPGGDAMEAVRPLSFNINLWNLLIKLYHCIKQCWHERLKLIQVDATLTEFRKNSLRDFVKFDCCNNIAKDEKLTPTNLYTQNINTLFKTLKAVQCAKIKSPNNYMHETTVDDWEIIKKDRGMNKGKNKGRTYMVQLIQKKA